jgi:hypothetical protein
MLANPDRQRNYYERVSIADVPSELISAWFDDGFYPEDIDFHRLFSDEEWKVLSEFNDFFEARSGKLPDSCPELKESHLWNEVAKKANEVLSYLKPPNTGTAGSSTRR